MKNKKINGWKLTAILSLILNGIVAILLVIGLTGSRSYTKTSAYGGYDINKIITSTQKIDDSLDYYLYFDWDNRSVDGNYNSFYFPISEYVSPFSVYLGRTFSFDNYSIIYLFERPESSDNIIFSAYTSLNGSHIGNYPLYVYKSQSEPLSILLEKYEGSDSPEFLNTYHVFEHFRNLFNGSIVIDDSNFIPYRGSALFDLTFLKGYFSQYSVQSLSLRQEWNITERINGVNFEGEYNWLYEPQNQNYTFLSNTLIVSKDAAMFNTSITNYSDIGFMVALEGLFKIDNEVYSKLVWVWREAKLNEYETVTYNNYLMDDLAGANDNHYYYLDSLCPYWEENSEVLIEYPIVIMHSDSITSTSNGGQLKNNLKMVIDSNFTNFKVTTLAIQLYPSQQVRFSNLGYLFKWVNNFYWYDGEVFIVDDTDSDIAPNNNGNIGNVFVVISNAFESLIPILSLMVLPGITLGMLIFLPIIATVIVVIIKIVKR